MERPAPGPGLLHPIQAARQRRVGLTPAMSLIVILDDRVTNRNIFSRLALSVEEGVAVRAFGDPLEALEWLDDNSPDLVITDYKMPSIDGAELTRRLRSHPRGADVPVIVITAYDDHSFRLRALEAGATDFLQTPVDHYEFLTRARNLLRLRKQQEFIKSRAKNLERELEASERHREEAIRSSRAQLARVIDTIPALISAADRDGRFLFVNAYLASFAGGEPADFVGHHVATIFGEEPGGRSCELDQAVFAQAEPLPSFEEEHVAPGGGRRFFLTTKSPLLDAHRTVTGVLTSSVDITDRKVAEAEMHHMAHHDALTNLPNRTLLQDRLRQELARARRHEGRFALHLLDLDRFKGVNDALGHQVGDRLLEAVATRLSSCVREADTVARLGGDEFAILQTDVRGVEDAAELAGRITEVMARPFIFDSQEIGTTASIGVTLHPTDGGDIDELLKNADLAMYRAKAEGRDGFRFFADEMRTLAEKLNLLEVDMRNAITRGEFVLHYQPQIDLATGRIIGAEALLRWQRPGWGLLRPVHFLAHAEDSGLIVPINEWVLREACMEARAWVQLIGRPLRVAVNLSPVQFRKQDVPQLVLGALEETGLAATSLELELTENIVMENIERAASNLRELQELGVGFSIDDFGTGYSSLGYIKRFPVDRLKIDKGFIRNLRTDPNDAAIVRAIISLGHGLNLGVTAEGAETADHLAHLRAEGCDEAQGNYLSPPLPAEDFRALIQKGEVLVGSS